MIPDEDSFPDEREFWKRWQRESTKKMRQWEADREIEIFLEPKTTVDTAMLAPNKKKQHWWLYRPGRWELAVWAILFLVVFALVFRWLQ